MVFQGSRGIAEVKFRERGGATPDIERALKDVTMKDPKHDRLYGAIWIM